MSAPQVHVEVEWRDRVAVVRLNRPPANALDPVLARNLADRLRAVRQEGAGAVVITGAGNCFSAGLDLKIVPSLSATARDALMAELGALLRDLYAGPIPTVAAVNGHAVAAGTLLVLACDYRVGPVADTQFGLTGVRVGIPYPPAALALIDGELSPAVRRRLVLSARTIDGEVAERYGILDERQPAAHVLDRAVEVATDLAGMPASTYARVKRDLRREIIERLDGSDAPVRPGSGMPGSA